MKTYPYQTIEDFVAEKRDRRIRWWVAFTVVPLCAFLVLFWTRDRKPAQPANTVSDVFTISGPSSVFPVGTWVSFVNVPVRIDPSPTQVDAWRAWRAAEVEARKKWRQAVPGLSVPLPVLADDGRVVCGSDGIACYSPSDKGIHIIEANPTTDRVTTMMHEIAHAMGVPHIEGDPLMDAQYQGALDAPSPAAVALARLKQTKAK